MCSPTVTGVKSVAFGFKHLRVTGTDGKKATRPCPCGYLGHSSGRCNCTPDQIARYRGRISGPLLDRMDLQIEVSAVSVGELRDVPRTESSSTVQARVELARGAQISRQGKPNALLEPNEIELHCHLDVQGEALLRQAILHLDLSARAYHRVLKVARTIADLAQIGTVDKSHVAEAIGYRRGIDHT